MEWYKDHFEQLRNNADADDLAGAILKHFEKYNVHIDLTHTWALGDRFIYKVKLKKNTREAHIRTHVSDVQLKLKLSLFLVKRDFVLYLIASRQEIEYDHLSAILQDPAYSKAQEQLQLPHVIGHNVWGSIVMDDLARYPHVLLGGSTNSGKSVGLQALITSIAYSKPPSQVNFILIDVGAADLMPFEELPHLSCPVVRDRMAAIFTLAALHDELERRIELEYADKNRFEQLPRLVLVIDEFPALFVGLEKAVSKTLSNVISSLLQRGRHAKIHVVLAAQNPTFQNMKVDLGNITARIAFKCAKKNFSETILGEGGAENLLGHGDLLLRSPRFDDPQRIQGIFITSDELHQMIQRIKAKPCVNTNKFTLAVPERDLAGPSGSIGARLSCSVVKGLSTADELLADALLWALGQESISINMLVNDLHLGWNKSAGLVRLMEELGVVETIEDKVRRRVIPNCFEDLPEELVKFLADAGYPEGAIMHTMCMR